MMNKFENSEDNNYKSVRRQIVKMVNGSKAIIDGRGLGKATPSQELKTPSTSMPWRDSKELVMN